MAYAGAFCLLQTYKMEKISSDYRLMEYQNELLEATQNSSSVNNLFTSKLTDLKRAQATALNAQASSNNDEKDIKRVLENVNGKSEDFNFSSSSIDALLKDIEVEMDAVAEEQEKALSEISADEQVWNNKVSNEQANNALLQTNIENCQQMLESNIQQSHTYGYTN